MTRGNVWWLLECGHYGQSSRNDVVGDNDIEVECRTCAWHAFILGKAVGRTSRRVKRAEPLSNG